MSSTPHEIDTTIDRVVTDLRKFGRDYKQVFEYVFSRKDRGSHTAYQRQESEVVQGKHVRRGMASDPTQDIAIGQMGAREALKPIPGKLKSIEGRVKALRSDLEKVLTSSDDDEYEPLRRLAAGEAQPGGHAVSEAQRKLRDSRAELARAEGNVSRLKNEVVRGEEEVKKATKAAALAETPQTEVVRRWTA